MGQSHLVRTMSGHDQQHYAGAQARWTDHVVRQEARYTGYCGPAHAGTNQLHASTTNPFSGICPWSSHCPMALPLKRTTTTSQRRVPLPRDQAPSTWSRDTLKSHPDHNVCPRSQLFNLRGHTPCCCPGTLGSGLPAAVLSGTCRDLSGDLVAVNYTSMIKAK